MTIPWRVQTRGVGNASLTEKLQLLADDKNLLNEMSQNALNNSKINSWENSVTKLNEIVDHLWY